jgi:hypothetical protein
VDRAHGEGALDGDEGPQARVPGFELHAREAILDGAPAGAAVAFQVHAEDAELGELGDELPRKNGPVEPVVYVRLDPVPHERPHAVAHRELPLGEVRLDVQEVVPGRVLSPSSVSPNFRA